VLTVERPFDGFHLSSNPSNTTQESRFVFRCVRHSLRPSK
jgi:hypothetical protein